MRNLAIVACVLAVATSVWTWMPKGETDAAGQSEQASEQLLTASGEQVDPNRVAALRVVTWDQGEQTGVPFEVKRDGGKWLIPSHFNYPADGGTRVGDTAGHILNVPMGPLVTKDKTRHAEYGLIDPLTGSCGTSPSGVLSPSVGSVR